jgi:hypothetical protein
MKDALKKYYMAVVLKVGKILKLLHKWSQLYPKTDVLLI